MYSNKHLVEVMCKFNFIPGEVNWDSGYFGQFYDKIREYGFTERQEKKGLKFEIINPQDLNQAIPNIEEADSEMIFRDPIRKFAITMGNAFVSYHIVSTYKNWESFNSDLMDPMMERYADLGIYEKIQSCQVVYLNHFKFENAENLSDYFEIVSPPLNQVGKETSVNINKSYITDSGIVLSVRLLPQASSLETKEVMVECGAIGTVNQGVAINTWRQISGDVRKPIREFFEAVITNKLRETL